MRWVAPTEKDTANPTLEKRLWESADQFRANSKLKAAQYSTPVLGLIFLRFAEARIAQRRASSIKQARPRAAALHAREIADRRTGTTEEPRPFLFPHRYARRYANETIGARDTFG